MRAIHEYELASGQRLNRDKTRILSSQNTSSDTQSVLQEFWDVSIVANQDEYLGLPTFVGRGKKQAFLALKEKIGKRIHGWQDKLLSIARKEILVKAVVQAIPTYAMSVFQLPVSLCTELNSLISNFWWGAFSSDRKIHWIKWADLCLPKANGGLGFRDLATFNKALLAKQGWNLISNPTSLVARVLKARYYPHSSFFAANVGNNASYTWRSIVGAKDILELGCRWRIGSGEDICVWKDRWLPASSSGKVVTQQNTIHEFATVSTLIQSSPRRWNVDLIDEIF